ncbi:MAG: hypothetical protein JF604_15985, partial [Bradyrhizobium sp.]|nr:hypothetical protein [Bradyrhizobium sp.]
MRNVTYFNFISPTVDATSAAFFVRHSPAHSGGVDSVSGTIRFQDTNVGDSPTVTAKFDSFKVLDAHGNDITGTLTAKQLAAIAAIEANLVITPSPGNTNSGSAIWTYSVADRALDFLGAGRTLELTYQAQIDTNFVGINTTASTPFTITISSPHAVEWIFPGDGLWSVGSNWKTGLVPTALDDAIIPALDAVSGTGHYVVTIAEAAFANSVTLDAFNTSGAELINHSALTVGDDLTLLNDSLLSNFGTVSAAFLLLHDHSSVQNFSLITLGQGGEWVDQSAVTNNETGIIELAGGTLNVTVSVANAGFMKIDPGATLTLGGATINGTIENRGVIDLIGAAALFNGSLSNFGLVDVSGNANALHNEIVSNFGSIHNTGEL